MRPEEEIALRQLSTSAAVVAASAEGISSKAIRKDAQSISATIAEAEKAARILFNLQSTLDRPFYIAHWHEKDEREWVVIKRASDLERQDFAEALAVLTATNTNSVVVDVTKTELCGHEVRILEVRR